MAKKKTTTKKVATKKMATKVKPQEVAKNSAKNAIKGTMVMKRVNIYRLQGSTRSEVLKHI